MTGKVTLVYIDPPFATQGTFLSRNQEKAYDDHLSGAKYVEHLRERLILLRELLSDNGLIYLHLDENTIFEMKLVMDEVFGPSNYRNLIVRKKCNPKNYTRKTYGNIADYILFYSKTDNYIWNRPVELLSEESTKEYHYTEPKTGRRYMKVPVHAPGVRNERYWIGIDNSQEALSAILKRFQNGLLPMGDFVSNRKVQKQHRPQQLTLFETLDESAASPTDIKIQSIPLLRKLEYF